MAETYPITGYGAPIIKNSTGSSTLVDFDDFHIAVVRDITEPPIFDVDHRTEDGVLRRDTPRVIPKFQITLIECSGADYTTYFATFEDGSTEVRFFPRAKTTAGTAATDYVQAFCRATFQLIDDNVTKNKGNVIVDIISKNEVLL
jgi:hypothetical protein